MFPALNSYIDIGPPKTKAKAWLEVVYSFAFMIGMEAIWAGIFAMGFHGILLGLTGDEFFQALLATIVGFLILTFWPIMIWDHVKEEFLFAWNFEKKKGG